MPSLDFLDFCSLSINCFSIIFKRRIIKFYLFLDHKNKIVYKAILNSITYATFNKASYSLSKLSFFKLIEYLHYAFFNF